MVDIIIAEDHSIVRHGLRSLLQMVPDLTVVAEAKNGAEAISLLTEGLQANLLLTDLNMPVMDGIALTKQVSAQFPQVKSIVLSALDHERYVVQSFNAGAHGFILKNTSADELVFAIKHVSAGNQYICSELTTRFLNRMMTSSEPVDTEETNEIRFSARETEVLNYLADGMTNQEIADKLFTSKRTVEGYRESMITRTGVRNTVALIRFAMRYGVIN
ncbi:response regulator transcription factor [Mucilaginibacter aquatilis]|uniref:Response regulator n=1 Tax=Mucilaginibacter aquatilis TaxID=1517760 RepID=A0A6I4ICN5_9SPHI|nr:response regulator transcription factor [Mucilaginibacter aquatilis]MVN92707.1 response regulator [Mucilaginibacter aquatilis]